jgi:hypothetical protein
LPTRSTKRFSRDEFVALFGNVADRCVRLAQEGCIGSIPTLRLFYVAQGDSRQDWADKRDRVGVPQSTLLPFEAVVPMLHGEDGLHRTEIRASPIGVTSEATVVDVCWDNQWVDWIFTGPEAFPMEPFILRGPPLPADWREGQPIPRVPLPSFETAPTGFRWVLTSTECQELSSPTVGVRRAVAERLVGRVLHGFAVEEEVTARLLEIARREPDPKVRRALAQVLSRSTSVEAANLIRNWMSDEDADVRSEAYFAFSEAEQRAQRVESAFEFLLARAPIETVSRSRRALLRAAGSLTEGLPDRKARLEQLRGRPRTPP